MKSTLWLRNPVRVGGIILVGALLAGGALAQGNVWVVDSSGGPGSNFTDLGLAIQGASSGDVLLVRNGYYPVYETIDARSLTLTADGSAVNLSGRIHVLNLTASQRVSLRGLQFSYGSQIELQDDQGVVWLERCSLQADLYGGSGSDGAVSANRAHVVVQDCFLGGSIQYGYYAAPPTAGLYLVDSTAAVMGGAVTGGDGLDTIYPDLPGACGVRMYHSTLVASGANILGGYGGTQPGGQGIEAHGGSVVSLHSVSLAGGGGTPAGDPSSADATSAVTTLAGAAETFTLGSPRRVGENIDLTVTGAAGDLVWMVIGLRPALTITPRGQALLLASPAFARVPLGAIPPGGTLSLSFGVPALGGAPSQEFYVQDIYLDQALGKIRFGPAADLLLLDASF